MASHIFSDYYTEYDAAVEAGMLAAARFRSELIDAMLERVSEDPAWDLRAAVLGYTDDEHLHDWRREGLDLDDIAQAMDDLGYCCHDCGEGEPIPGHPGEHGPTCAACETRNARNAELSACGGVL